MSCKADLEISSLSVQYVKVPVRATVNGQPHDPTGDVVQIAIVGHDVTPAPADWHTGSWETTPQGEYLARLLVGPGQLPLAVGFYDVWVKIVDNPETPVLEAGILRVE